MSEIRGYTLAQFAAFSRAASRARRARMRDEAINLRASQYEKNEFVAYLNKLDAGDD